MNCILVPKAETAFVGFNRPFLLLPEHWYSVIPKISYRELVYLFATAKFVDFSEAQQNFDVAQKIWSKEVSLMTLIDTLSHATIKRADTAFFTIVGHRNHPPSNDKEDKKVFQAELLELINSFYNNYHFPDYFDDLMEKIGQIALKAGYLDVFESCLPILINLKRPPKSFTSRLTSALPEFLSDATSSEIGSKVISLILKEGRRLYQIELIVARWLDLSTNNERFLLEETKFSEKVITTTLHRINLKFSEDTLFHKKLQRQINKMIYGLNIIREFSKYGDMWGAIILEQLKSNQQRIFLPILSRAPFPKSIPSNIQRELFDIAVKNKQTEFCTQFIQLNIKSLIERATLETHQL